MNTRLHEILAAFLLAVAANASLAFSCDHCGCADPCQKTCRLVCEQKKVEITCWGCKCEDFCVPGPSKPGCKHCETVCEDCQQCDPNGVQYQSQNFVWKDWIPGCATIHTRKKLMKKTVTKTIPSYKWVVEDLCPRCQSNAHSASVPAGTSLPQAPSLFGTKMTVLPVGFLQPDSPAAAETASGASQNVSAIGVQRADFRSSLAEPAVPPAPARPGVSGHSWRDALKLPWQR